FQNQGDRIVFAPKPQLRNGEELIYRVKVQGVNEGRHLLRAIVQSAESSKPVAKEESTMVYSDR
ncbi:MAG: hypothetical protein AAGA03_20440, partial [Planctomycetota bacterium]